MNLGTHLAGTLLATVFTARLFGQESPPAPETTLSGELSAVTRTELIAAVVKAVNEGYVDANVAARAGDTILIHARQHDYDAVTHGSQMAQMLTEHLQSVTHDKHLRLMYSMRPTPSTQPGPALGNEREVTILQRANFGFERVERLGGNVGYLDLRGFAPAPLMRDTATAAMNLLANTYAVIIDLRNNTGGDTAAVALMASYLFGGEPVHLLDTYSRVTNNTTQTWTAAILPGRRLATQRVYILTSRETASGGEGLAYALKNLKRATIVGEVTAGAAHPSIIRRLDEHFSLVLPVARVFSPVTGTDWEGVGVQPDVTVPADRAFATAYLLALRTLEPTFGDAPRLRAEALQKIQQLEGELSAAVALTGDATGTWVGTIKMTAADRVAPMPAYLMLKQQDSTMTMTGTGGSDASQQFPIEHGRVTDGVIQFEVTFGPTLAFELKRAGDEMTGKVTLTGGGRVQDGTIALKRTSR